MLNPPEMDLAPMAAWGIEIPEDGGPAVFQSFAWEDAGGAVDLTDYRLDGRIVWDGGSIALSTDPDGGIAIGDQAELKGWFSVRITAGQARQLPRELPVIYAFRADDGEGFGPPILRGQVYPSWGAFS